MKKRKILFALFILCVCNGILAQKTITGTVRDASNEALPGVTVTVKGSQRGTATDFNGNYVLSLRAGDSDLVFSYIGMKTHTAPVGNRATVDVVLEENTAMLSEVVVSALGIKRESKSLPVSQQRVDAATIAEVRDVNLVSSLAGKVAGVLVTPPPSATGSARIVIRGNSSFTGNNQPLFVVDGMAVDNSDGSQSAGRDGGLDMGNGAADINPDDIESIDVLKGPNAAALYGSRAANGVIIITTKKAKSNRFKVSVKSNTMFRYITQWPAFQNSFGMGHNSRIEDNHNHSILLPADAGGNLYPYPGLPGMEEIAANGSQGGRSNGGPLIGIPYIGLDGQVHTYSPEPNNVYDFYRRASTYTNNLSLEGGNVDNNYRLSFTNYNADDVVEKQNRVNKNTLNLRFFNTLAKNLSLDSKLTYIDDVTRNRRYANQSGFNPLYMYTILARSMTLDQLKFYKTPAGSESVMVGGIHNPYWSINETGNRDNKLRVLGNFDLSWQLLPSLRATVMYGREYISTNSMEFRNRGALGGGIDEAGFYRRQFNIVDNAQYEWRLVYNGRLANDRVSLLGTLGGQQLDYKGSWLNASLESLKQAGFAHISNSDLRPMANEDILSQKRIRGLYGSLSVGFRDFVYLDFTGRNDWSSTLPPENNSYFYPSAGISVLPAEMLGISSDKFYGKLRASYAQVGNDTDPYRLLPYMDLGSGNIYGGYKYVSLPGTVPNSHLRPERTRSLEFGTDIRLLKSRLNFDITYYQANSFDQIVEADMSLSSGYERRVFNAGEIRNKGWEVAVNTTPIQLKDFQWNLDFNYTKNESEVLSMVDGLDQIQLGQIFDFYNVIRVGLPYGSMYGSKWLTDKQGRRMVTSSGDPVKVDYDYLGNFNPDYMFSINNRFRWKNFDAYLLIDMKKGGKLYSGTMRQAIRNGVTSGSEKQRESYWKRTVIMGESGGAEDLWGGSSFDNLYVYDATQYDNINDMNQLDPNYEPQPFTGYLWPGNVGYWADSYCSEVTYDASYVKLRELGIGYYLPKSWISKIKMSNARISIVGRNLWVIYQKTPKGIDPEAALNAGNGQGMESGSLPPSTTFGFDIKIEF
ncbi:MAG: SusC/RagA family TonB-linked outer membrane protein [Dysgonamonadaceae bacterium]|jgi:TonB-linked SusC/RagA family outer membrane protein|nr:SusC/RagA family TonB-linked outer membrane protein [Dysgonamonadaceae bacterium]